MLTGHEPATVAPGVVAIPTPGHTAGHVMFLLCEETLFTGDSLAWDPYVEDLSAEAEFCWYSWPQQLSSLERLARHSFVRVVPTHGALSPTLAAGEMRSRLQRLVARLRS